MSQFQTLNKNSDFRRCYQRGRVYTDPALVIYIVRRRAGICRIGITASKTIGNAVQRNRARRVIRAATEMLPPLKTGFDIVFVARTRTLKRKSTEIYPFMKKTFEAAGLLSHEN